METFTVTSKPRWSSKIKEYYVCGPLSYVKDGDGDGIVGVIFVDGELILADWLQGVCYNKFVTIDYVVNDTFLKPEDMNRSIIEHLYGKATISYGHCYSDITGYLWTDEECTLGGHDIIEELRTHMGSKWSEHTTRIKYLCMRIKLGKVPH